MQIRIRIFTAAALCLIIFSGAPARAEEPVSQPESAGTVTMTQRQVVALAARLIARGSLEDAQTLLSQQPFNVLELEIERLYLLGNIAAREQRFRDAIEIWRHILDYQPDLARVRFELALAYMATGQWYRADYHMRLAAADPDLPPHIQMLIRRHLFTIRQNKNWNVWVNVGISPEDNINNASGGEECITFHPVYTPMGLVTPANPMCRPLSEPESAMGFNLGVGGDYEIKLDDRWRIKSDIAAFGNFYDKPQYNMYFLSASTGPRYVFPRGDVWLAAAGHKMYLGGESYRHSVGARAETNYDFTRRMSGTLVLRYAPTYYNGDMAELLDGDIYGANMRLRYMFSPRTSLMLRAGIEREDAKSDAHANWRRTYAVGVGAEIPWGFRVYVEPSVTFTDFDGPRFAVVRTPNGFEAAQITAKDFTQRYLLSLSNNKIRLYGFSPVLNFTYMDRSSNIDSRAHHKAGVAFTLQQRF